MFSKKNFKKALKSIGIVLLALFFQLSPFIQGHVIYGSQVDIWDEIYSYEPLEEGAVIKLKDTVYIVNTIWETEDGFQISTQSKFSTEDSAYHFDLVSQAPKFYADSIIPDFLNQQSNDITVSTIRPGPGSKYKDSSVIRLGIGVDQLSANEYRVRTLAFWLKSYTGLIPMWGRLGLAATEQLLLQYNSMSGSLFYTDNDHFGTRIYEPLGGGNVKKATGKSINGIGLSYKVPLGCMDANIYMSVKATKGNHNDIAANIMLFSHRLISGINLNGFSVSWPAGISLGFGIGGDDEDHAVQLIF